MAIIPRIVTYAAIKANCQKRFIYRKLQETGNYFVDYTTKKKSTESAT